MPAPQPVARIREIYRQSRKPQDIFFNVYVARPVAALVVFALRDAPVTPNQVTFASLALFGVAGAALALGPAGLAGALAGALLVEASYVLDCVDGQLARLRRASSEVGAHLDFLMDELKAFLLVAAVAARLWRHHGGDERFLLLGLAGLVAVASGISMTTFMRRPEYRGAAGAPAGPVAADAGPRSPIAAAIALVERACKLVIHYPSWILVPAALDRLDLFLYLYLAVHAAYLGRSLLQVVLKLGRPAPRPGASS